MEMQHDAISNYEKEKFVMKQNFPSVNLNIDTRKSRHFQIDGPRVHLLDV